EFDIGPDLTPTASNGFKYLQTARKGFQRFLLLTLKGVQITDFHEHVSLEMSVIELLGPCQRPLEVLHPLFRQRDALCAPSGFQPLSLQEGRVQIQGPIQIL